uniref:Flippase-like domain-containing protein n=1 Tax=Geobacter sp. (strain M21) TaxID=443144 RepID=C6DYF4_GEOSM
MTASFAHTLHRINLALLALSALFLWVALSGADWQQLLSSLSAAGRYLPLLLVPYALTSFLWTASWSALLADAPAPPAGRLYLVRLAGESLNQLTPAASFGGEPFKAQLLHAEGVGWQEATASLAVHKAVTVLSLVCYILAALLLLPAVLPRFPLPLALAGWVGTFVLGAGASVFLWLQRRSPCSSLIRLLQRLGLCPAALLSRQEELARFDATLSGFYRKRKRAAVIAFGLYLLGWAMHALEVYLAFRILGHPIPLELALCLDGLSQLASALGFMIPASLGVQDGGIVGLSLVFNLGATLGAGLSVLRRLREACWLSAGLLAGVVLARDGKTRRRRNHHA